MIELRWSILSAQKKMVNGKYVEIENIFNVKIIIY